MPFRLFFPKHLPLSEPRKQAELVLSRKGPTTCMLHMNGSVFGLGSLQKNHLQGQMGNLRNRIELAATEKEPKKESTAPTSMATELEKLAALRTQGLLTEEEFQKAKERLLGG